ncbi:PXDN [Mytilus coruscus]|uniref:PXDN n=1 Tax=Mytilus coruscus TaxID=42192 RepID=A0A6J8BMJ0_MYTCO|nr:PXDN [Mytilus coruscus]
MTLTKLNFSYYYMNNISSKIQENVSIVCDADAKYRTIDGSCNNLNNPGFGKANTLFERFVDGNGNKIFDYADGKDNIPNSVIHIDFCFPLEIPGNDKVLAPGCLKFVRATPRMDADGAHRYGHSQLTNKQRFVDEGCNTVTVNYLKDTFESPRLVQQNNGANIPFLARHLACTASNKIDNFITDGMHNFLLRLPEAPESDIVARNIQRGRDQGVSGYNTWRELCGLQPIKSFNKFGSEPNDVNLFIGAMLEKAAGFNVGPTFQCLLGIQYQRIKCGDRF